MTGKDPLDELVDAICRHYDPVERLAEAVCAVFADRAARDGGERSRQLANADLLARHRELRARSEARYGPAEGLFDRLQARGSGLSAQIWS